MIRNNIKNKQVLILVVIGTMITTIFSGISLVMKNNSNIHTVEVTPIKSFKFGLGDNTDLISAGINTIGLGSYTDVIPPGASGPPSTIWKTNNLNGPVQTNDWISSVLFESYSQPLYAHPLAYRAVNTGMEVGFPYYTGSGTFLHRSDFVISSNTFNPIDARLDKTSDWFADIMMASGSNYIKASIGHGSPYVFFEINNGNPVFTFDGAITVFSNNGQYIGITTHYGNNFGIFAPSGSSWSGANSGSTSVTLNIAGMYFSIAGLPDASVNTLHYYADHAYAFITDTQVSWDYDGMGSVTTTYQFTTTPREGSNTNTIIALYPHQWRDNPYISPLSYTYSTVRGMMKTILGKSYQTNYRYNGILPMLPDQGTYDVGQLSSLVDEAINGLDLSNSIDTYWGGKEIGRLALLLPIAEQLGDIVAANSILNAMKGELERWLQADGDEDFYYDNTWGTLIGYPASYGSETNLNDHHFHYGYWIHAAAQIALRDKDWASQNQWGGMINMLIGDIATYTRDNSMFPLLRNFDIYEGHSWASGDAMFFTGNNQESSSESINAWAALILWGEATGDTAIRNTGIYLYTTEVKAINNYYFNLYDDVFTSDYSHSCASMVWGGQYNHATWWTADPLQIHGIIMLPIIPASLYLGTDPNYVRRNYDEAYEEWPAFASQFPTEADIDIWADILIEYLALSDPATAISKGNSIGIWDVGGGFNVERGESKAHSYHWVYNLDSMGLPDFSVTADTPLYNVFNKKGLRTYVVYNAKDNMITVTFSDGYIISNVPPNSIAVNGGGISNTKPPLETLIFTIIILIAIAAFLTTVFIGSIKHTSNNRNKPKNKKKEQNKYNNMRYNQKQQYQQHRYQDQRGTQRLRYQDQRGTQKPHYQPPRQNQHPRNQAPRHTKKRRY